MKNAYCGECATRVMLAENGECENGHPRSALRDVQDGPIASVTQPRVRVAAGLPVEGGPNLKASEETAAKLMGRLIIIVPLAIVIAFALWSSYAISLQFGMSKTSAWLSSVGDLLLVGLGVWFAVWNRRRKM